MAIEPSRSASEQASELEGTWEEILAHSHELAGRRVKLIVLPAGEMAGEQAGFSAAQPLGNNSALGSLDSVRRQIIELMRDDDPTARPTTYAQNITWLLISAVSEHLGESFPLGFVMEDEQGGVRIEWENQAKHVRLVIPGTSAGQQYIYHQQGDAYGTEDVSAPALEGWLSWLASI